MRTVERNGESKLQQKLLTPASWDNDIKTDVAVVVKVSFQLSQVFKELSQPFHLAYSLSSVFLNTFSFLCCLIFEFVFVKQFNMSSPLRSLICPQNSNFNLFNHNNFLRPI